ncbi:MAG: RNA polymerase sigma factor [Lentisphaerae bacterium]|nr:RNA polymerase sigma factor [Lentisphaerota bacterium]
MNTVPPALSQNLATFTAFARKRLGDRALAEDVVQDSLLRALKADRVPANHDEVVTWFYRILRRAIIDIYRRRDTRQRALERFRAEFDESPSPADERTLCQCFRRLLPAWPASYRETLQRVDLDGQTPAEAAAALGISLNNLNVRLHRARKRLRQELERTCRTCSKHGCLDCTCS